MAVRSDLELAATHGGKVYRYVDLPAAGRATLDRRYAEYDQPSPDDDCLFGYVLVPMLEMLTYVAGNHDLQQDWSNDWAGYAAWYASDDDVPDHGDSVWAVLLSDYDEDRLEDGWHRFHSYVKKGIALVPCVYKP